MSYDQGAEVYQRVMAPVLAIARRPLMESIPLEGARTILDVGTGPGLLLRELQEICPQAHVVGIDLSTRMLALAPKGFPLSRMDAQRLAFRDSTFDAAFLSFVITSLPQPEVCLMEAKRVLRDGGALGTATWQARESQALRQWISFLDEAGASPVEDQTQVAAEPSKMTQFLEQAGFSGIRCWASSFRFTLSAGDFIALRSSLGMSAQRLRSIPAQKRAELIREFESRLQQMSEDERTETGSAVLSISTA